MKKQKAPIIPILLVIIMLGWVGYSQLPKGKPDPAQPAQAKDDKKAPDVGKDVSSMMNEDKSTPGAVTAAPLRKVELSSLLKPEMSAMKPKPNPTATSSQWYVKDANQPGG